MKIIDKISIKWKLMFFVVLAAVPVFYSDYSVIIQPGRKQIKQIEDNLSKETLIISQEVKNVYNCIDNKSKKDEQIYQKILLDSLSKLVIGKTGYVFILDGSSGENRGKYILSSGRKRDGENVWNAKDSSGKLFIQDMINATTGLKDGEVYTIYYPWQNKGENKARMKIAACSYFPEWNWVIGCSAYHEEFLDGLNQIKLIAVTVAFIAIILTVLFGLFIVHNITGIIKSLQQETAKLIQSTTSGKLDVRGEPEKINFEFRAIIEGINGLLDAVIGPLNVQQSILTGFPRRYSSEDHRFLPGRFQ
jgi:signal transduction histidine kinase